MGLPIADTLRDTTQNLRVRRARLIRALALPSTLIAAVSAVVWFLISYPRLETLRYVPALSVLQIPLWGLLAVSCHRVLLDDPDQPTVGDGVWPGLRQLRYILLAIIVAIPVLVYGAALPLLVFPRFDLTNSDTVSRYIMETYKLGLLIPLQYISSRFSLALPAAALQEPMSLAQAWCKSKGSGWRLTAVLLAAPLAYKLLFPLIDSDVFDHLMVYGIFTTVVQIATGIFSIAALSYSYYWFMNDGLGIDAE
jgi:hypothetical protein